MTSLVDAYYGCTRNTKVSRAQFARCTLMTGPIHCGLMKTDKGGVG